MRIGVNGILLAGPPSGATRRIENLVKNLLELDQEIILYVSSKKKLSGFDSHPKLQIVPLAIPPFPSIARASAERVILSQRLAEDHLDWIECSHFPVPPTLGVPLIVTLHDLRHLAIFEHSPFSRRLLSKQVYQDALDRAQKIIAVSEFTKNEILRFLKIEPEKIAVVPNAADHLPIPPTNTARQKTLLYVGHLEARKNLSVLLQAFAKIRQKGFSHRLRLAGSPKGDYESKLRAEAKSLGIDEAIDWLGEVPEDKLSTLYASAELFVFPSIYEGFGIPLLEAMRCGTPVLAADSSSLREVGGNACEFAHPDSLESWSKAIESLLKNPLKRESLSRAGKEREKLFRWKTSAKKLISALES